MRTLILNLDDRVERRLTVPAPHSRKPLPDWAAEQLTRQAIEDHVRSASSYTAEWKAAVGSIGDPSFEAPARPLPGRISPSSDINVDIRAMLEQSGEIISQPDLWIAAITRATGGTRVTHHTREFSRVPGLIFEDWLDI